MSYPYVPPPRQPNTLKLAALAVALSAVFVAVVLGILVIVVAGRTPHYTTSEQDFLAEIRAVKIVNRYPIPYVAWPDDRELVRQAHEICTLEDQGVDRNDLVVNSPIGRPTVPKSLKVYPLDQRDDLVHIANRHLCPQYSLWVGGIPI